MRKVHNLKNKLTPRIKRRCYARKVFTYGSCDFVRILTKSEYFYDVRSVAVIYVCKETA